MNDSEREARYGKPGDTKLRCDICGNRYPYQDVYVSPGDGFAECKHCSPHMFEKVEAHEYKPRPGEAVGAGGACGKEGHGVYMGYRCPKCVEEEKFSREREEFERVRQGLEPGEQKVATRYLGSESDHRDAGDENDYERKLQERERKLQEEEADPDTWPYTFLKDFIDNSILAIKMVSVPDNPGSVRHEPNGCKHCKALKALDLLVEQRRDQVLDLLSMIIELGSSKNAVIDEYVRYTEELEKQDREQREEIIQLKADLYMASRDLQVCHDSKQHEIGAKCGELQDKLTDVTLIVMAHPRLPDSLKTSIKRIVDA